MKQRHIYFIRPVGQDGPVKIGCSESPDKRLRTLMTGSPARLEIAVTIPGDRRLERQIHITFADSRHHREWFHASERMNEFIRQIVAGRPIGELISLPPQELACQNPSLQAAIKKAGSQKRLADLIKTSQSQVGFWLNDAKKGLPAEIAVLIENAIGISRHELRPDIFGRETS